MIERQLKRLMDLAEKRAKLGQTDSALSAYEDALRLLLKHPEHVEYHRWVEVLSQRIADLRRNERTTAEGTSA